MNDLTATYEGLQDRLPEVAVFGVGAIEQHGAHLPVGTDWIIACELSRRVAEKLDAFLVPALPFSLSQCHGPTPGTVWLKPLTLAQVVEDVIVSVYQGGIKNIVVINCHGGNFILLDVIERLNRCFEDLCVVMPPESLASYKGIFSDDAPEVEVHAGEVETSLQLFLNPECVRKDRVVDHVPTVGREFMDYAFLKQISSAGVWGRPSRGTVSKGRQYLERLVDAYVNYVREALDFCHSRRQP